MTGLRKSYYKNRTDWRKILQKTTERLKDATPGKTSVYLPTRNGRSIIIVFSVESKVGNTLQKPMRN